MCVFVNPQRKINQIHSMNCIHMFECFLCFPSSVQTLDRGGVIYFVSPPEVIPFVSPGGMKIHLSFQRSSKVIKGHWLFFWKKLLLCFFELISFWSSWKAIGCGDKIFLRHCCNFSS